MKYSARERHVVDPTARDRLLCMVCKKVLPFNSFSARQSKNSRYVNHPTKPEYSIRSATCIQCTAKPLTSKKCVQCGETKPLEKFSGAQRKNMDLPECNECIIQREIDNKAIRVEIDEADVGDDVKKIVQGHYWELVLNGEESFATHHGSVRSNPAKHQERNSKSDLSQPLAQFSTPSTMVINRRDPRLKLDCSQNGSTYSDGIGGGNDSKKVEIKLPDMDSDEDDDVGDPWDGYLMAP